MGKINIGVQGFTMPMPQTILGCRQGGRSNFMALAWTTRVNYNPALIMASVGKKHFSNSAIKENGEFSVNIPSSDMVEIADFVGLVSGSQLDKSELFTIHKGTLENAPIIAECPMGLECKVIDSMELPNDTLFIGEVIATWCNEEVLTEGIPDVKKVDPFTLTMPDNRYWTVGECIGRAWHEGKKLK